MVTCIIKAYTKEKHFEFVTWILKEKVNKQKNLSGF